jgi:hypothetical protein
VFVGFGFESFWCFIKKKKAFGSGIFLGVYLVWIVWFFLMLTLVGCFMLLEPVYLGAPNASNKISLYLPKNKHYAYIHFFCYM